MGRPQKEGLDYFPLDTVLDTKFELIEAEFGIKGFAVVVKLLQKIYREHGYYCEWTEEVKLLFSRKINEGCNLVSEIVTAAIKRGIFDKNLFAKYQILTSAGVQKRYLEITSRRLNAEIKKEYLLISDTVNTENVNINSINVSNNSENVSNNPQSKVNKSKVNKSKVNKSSERVAADDSNKHPHGEMQNVLLTDEEFEILKQKFPVNYEDMINNLSLAISSKGYKYNSHYATILRWAKDRMSEKDLKKESKFHNFEQRETDFQELEDEYFDDLIGEREL